MRGWISLGAFAVVVSSADVAHACSWGDELQRIAPSGSEHPANAAVVMYGIRLAHEELVVTVDGEPAEVVLDEAHSVPMLLTQGWEVLTVRVEPQPEPGQAVSIRGNVCFSGCGVFELDYVATEPDLEIATASGTLDFDVARLNHVDSNGTCGPSGSFLPTRVELDVDAFADEELALLEVVARNASAGLERHIGSVLDENTDFSKWIVFDESLLGDAFPIEGWCVDVQVVDPAGNIAPIASSCDACRVAQAMDDDASDQLQFEPVPGGPCDEASDSSSSSGADTTSSSSSSTSVGTEVGVQDDHGLDSSDDAPAADDPTLDRGCGCTSETAASPWWLAVLPFAWRRRAQPRSAFQ